ncbi:MAG: hypothetical protein ACJAYP_001468 [Flavobacterium sp.]|jgi:hypothetical protein
MSYQICSCEGLNPKCEKCYGSGYMKTKTSAKTDTKNKKTISKDNLKSEALLSNDAANLHHKEIQNIADKIIAALDLKSMQQMRMLHSIPFNTTTFRRDFKDKFISFEIMETEKRALRSELAALSKELTKNNLQVHFKFNHLLSDKDIDVTSNRELKTLIREYKKLNKK